MTYSDCLCDVNIDSLVAFHRKHGKILTVTGVRPPSRFGTFLMEEDDVTGYTLQTKLMGGGGRLNGGFMVAEPSIFDYVDSLSECSLENEVFFKLVEDSQVAVYPHEGFWQSIDTERDVLILNDLYQKNVRPWFLEPNQFRTI